jgi:outer membrane protein assembly factor BamB
MHQKSLWRVALLIAATLAIAGCDTLESLNPFSGEDDPKLQGTRVAVLQLDQTIKPDPAAAATPVTAPAPTANSDWPEAGGSPSHAMGNLALPAHIDLAWQSSIGDGSSSGVKLLSQPVVAQGTIFTLDASAQITATDPSNGDRKWQVTISPQDAREETLGGGMGYGDGRLYVSAGFPEAMALDIATGKVLWKHKTNAPTRGAPLFSNGRVFVLTIENQLLALDAKTGKEEWTHSGVPETESFLSDAGTAADNTVVIAPYSSGEVFALRAETGRVAWSDNLSAVRRASALWSLTDFNGLPIIDNGKVFAVSVSGRIVAIDERTGTRIWQQEIGSSATPWIAGDFLYLLSPDNQLIALSTDKGAIHWVKQLDRYEDPEKRRYPIFWTGAVVAGGRVILANSASQLVELSISDGSLIKKTELPGPVFVTPIVANNTLYIVTDDGDLLAYH